MIQIKIDKRPDGMIGATDLTKNGPVHTTVFNIEKLAAVICHKWNKHKKYVKDYDDEEYLKIQIDVSLTDKIKQTKKK